MSLSTLKRQIDDENRQSNPAWTDKYLFILPSHPNAKPMCLLCNECVAVCKDYSVRRHHNEKHPTFWANFPEGSQERAEKVQSLIACHNRSSTPMVRNFLRQMCLKRCWKNWRKLMSCSSQLMSQQTEVILHNCALTFYGKCFREELLGLLPLEGHTTGETVFEKISAFFKDSGLDMERVCMLVTDGAPLMAGKVSGSAARWSAVAPQSTSLHCIILFDVPSSDVTKLLPKWKKCCMFIITLICVGFKICHYLQAAKCLAQLNVVVIKSSVGYNCTSSENQMTLINYLRQTSSLSQC